MLYSFSVLAFQLVLYSRWYLRFEHFYRLSLSTYIPHSKDQTLVQLLSITLFPLINGCFNRYPNIVILMREKTLDYIFIRNYYWNSHSIPIGFPHVNSQMNISSHSYPYVGGIKLPLLFPFP